MLERALEQASRLLASTTASEEMPIVPRSQAFLASSTSKDGNHSVSKSVRPVRSTTMYVSTRPQSGIESGDVVNKRRGNKKSIKDRCLSCEDAANDRQVGEHIAAAMVTLVSCSILKQILMECISQLKESVEYLLVSKTLCESQCATCTFSISLLPFSLSLFPSFLALHTGRESRQRTAD